MKDFYAILGVLPNASQEEIKKAYYALAHANHPDKNPFGAGVMVAVNEAYEVLKDSARRRKYDIESKVRQFVKPEAVRPLLSEDGKVDLLGLAKQFLPHPAASSLEPLIKKMGLTPNAATLEEALQALGVLPKKRRRRAS